ncbi:acyltransferase family protein [Microbacterium invictum]|uniref:Peptidoglycan/LPS O-acetylase OafA/YrhL n=1 Tax=Microbacterium invictum TaxID=515415 RepID=A0AA40VMH0_9MICO|nr:MULTISPECIES: acyltransferase family protein [Microbacterium]MBB4139293.1 peptidoglycan/LPS O-acetylase OafA/YrhL [Microbacterium invictum]
MSTVQADTRTTPHIRRGATRDTGIDFVRALCVTAVVVLHAMMVGVTVTGSGPVFENAADGSTWIAPLSWILQVMPLFFVIGGFSGLLAYRRQRTAGGTAASFVAARLHRLLRPALVTVGVVGVVLVALAVAGVPADLIAVAGHRYGQPLWFLGVFLLCQALLPALAAAHERAPVRTIAILVVATVAVDAVRAATGLDAVGFVNLAFAWLALQQLGFFLADGSLDRIPAGVRVVAGVTAVAALVTSWVSGIYSPDLIAHINPPTAALLLVGVAHTSALTLLRGRLRRLSRRPRAAAFTDFVTARTMTVYLWHMPVLLAMAGLCAVFALSTGAALPTPSSLGWWLTRPLWLAVALASTAVVAVALARFEAGRLPATTESAWRTGGEVLTGLIAIVMLLVLGTSPSTAAIAVLLMGAALGGVGVLQARATGWRSTVRSFSGAVRRASLR